MAEKLKVQIKRIDKGLPLPVYQTAGSVAVDLCSRVDVTIEPKKIALLPSNIVVKIPEGFFLLLTTRSSTPAKKGLVMPNGVGIIDQDYCGPEDEIKLQLMNITDEPVKVARGERIAQALFVSFSRVDWEEIDDVGVKSRGGFGSTSV